MRPVTKKKQVIKEGNRKKNGAEKRENLQLKLLKKCYFLWRVKNNCRIECSCLYLEETGRVLETVSIEARRAKPSYEIMISGCISWHGVGTTTVVNGNIYCIEIPASTEWKFVAGYSSTTPSRMSMRRYTVPVQHKIFSIELE